jgi:large subunit ribosomal protein L15
MLKLHNLESAGKDRKRIGRGGARGGTSGRGHKGQKARTGDHAMRRGFEGGQMPLYRRLPKRGFNNYEFAKETEIVSLEVIDNKFDNGQVVDRALLLQAGLIKKETSKIKVLGGYTPSKKLTIVVDSVSKSVKEAVEASGGQVRVAGEE